MKTTPKALLVGTVTAAVAALAVSMAGASGPAPSPLPVRHLTPGQHTYATLAQVCAQHTTDYAIPVATQKQVFKRYGLSWSQRKDYVVDRLIPANLGGTNTLANYWPLPLVQQPAKIKVSYQLHDMLCDLHIGTLHAAQVAMVTNWQVALHHLVIPADPRPFPANGMLGLKLAAGTYTAPGGLSCYYERDSDKSGTIESIIGSGFGETDPIVTVGSTDVLFRTNSCGQWTKISN